MVRRPCLLAAVLCLFAQLLVIFGSEFIKPAAVLIIIIEIILFVLFLTGKVRYAPLIPVIFLTFIVIFDSVVKLSSFSENEIEGLINKCKTTGLTGCVKKSEQKGDSLYVYIGDIKTENGKATGLIAVVDNEAEDILPGCQIIVKGDAQEMSRATNPGQFDSQGFYMAQGYLLRCSSPEIMVTVNAGLPYRLIFGFKCAMKNVLEKISDPDDRGVWFAMLLGDKNELEEETKDLFSEGGISHILAISGLHISFIGMIIFWILRKGTGSYLIGSFVSGVCIAFYTVMTGASISSLRALIMMILTLIASCLGRTPDILSSMSVSWIIVAIIYPFQITQAGCLLSFGAILGVGLVLPVFESNIRIEKKKGEGVWIKILRNSLRSVLCTLAVSVTTWPVLSWFYYEISVYSLFVNLLVLPLTSLLFGSLLFSALFGMGLKATGISLIPARIALIPAEAVLSFYKWLCSVVSELPGHLLITGRPHIWQIIIYICFWFIILLTLYLVDRKKEKNDAGSDQKSSDRNNLKAERELSERNELKTVRKLSGENYLKAERESSEKDDETFVNISSTGVIKSSLPQYILYFMILLALLTISGKILIRIREKEMKVCFMDVGQGDGIFIQTEKATLFIDGGSTSVSSVGLYRIKPLLLYYGVTHIDAWIVTHPDKDHICGLIEILEEYSSADTPSIGTVITSAAGSENEAWSELSSLLEKNGISRQFISEGMGFMQGGIFAECLYPRREETLSDPNDLCCVIKLEYGQESFLFTGDISSEVEELIINRYKAVPEKLSADVLKVAHHGSKYSSADFFLNLLEARLAVISCGKNTYGHPALEAIQNLEEAGMKVLRTDKSGAVEVKTNGEEVVIFMYGE